jgi:dihydropyrimidinase
MTAAKFHATAALRGRREATHRAISLAELLDVPMLLVHVSAKEAMHEIQRAQARGLKVYGETCPQYLFLSEEDFEKPGDEGSKCVCSPPPRGTDNQEHIWTGLAAGTFQVLSSDHAAFKYDDVRGKKLPGAAQSFRKIPNGVPGVETRLPLFLEGQQRRLTRSSSWRSLDQPRQDLRPASAQGHDSGRRRCRHRAVGSHPQGKSHQFDPAPQLRLHAL